MGITREYLLSSLSEGLLPLFRRAFEDVVYEVLDQRQVPTRTDMQELRQSLEGMKTELANLRTEVEALQRPLEAATSPRPRRGRPRGPQEG